MRKLFMAVLALAGASSLFMMPARVSAQQMDEGIIQEMRPEGRVVTRAARLRSSNLPHPANDPDTVWIGHIDDAAYTAGGKMVAGGVGPYHVGRGPNFPTRSGGTLGSNGTWSLDRFQAGETDSLFGWWPANKPYQSTGSFTGSDYLRAFHCLDYGNQANYVINEGRVASGIAGDGGYMEPPRTFGVVGVWHRDHGSLVGGTVPVDSTGTTTSAGAKSPWYSSTQAYPAPAVTYGVNVQPVLWSPVTLGGTGSTASAWMGIRSAGDNTEKDSRTYGGTGNPFNASLYQYQGVNFANNSSSTQANGTDHNFPGYAGQMDQMLYRDVQLASGDWLNITFNYSTNMATSFNTATGSRAGWFDKDPVGPAATGSWTPPTGGQTAANDNNFISSSLAGSNAPRDSFMVYIGAPVNDANVKFAGTLTVGGFPITTVYDKKRRWFSEVIRCVNSDQHYREILSKQGDTPPTSFGIQIPPTDPALMDIKAQGGNSNVVRIVFRVKTDRQYDDENGGNTTSPYSSGTKGAAIIDNVTATGQAGSGWDFEDEGSIDNRLGTTTFNAWKSTGKPPPVYWHKRPLAGSYFSDPCGDVDNALRQCNMYGNVVTPGDKDAAESQIGPYGGNNWERGKWLVSPTVNLVATANGTYNDMGIDDEIARATGNYNSFFSLYNAGFVNGSTVTGNFLSVHWQAYPARQKNGNIGWGECVSNGSISSYGAPRGCFETFFIPTRTNNVIKTINVTNRPDSLRYYLFGFTRCFGQFIPEATCGSLVGFNVGIYFDNMSLAIIDAPPPAAISLSIWNLLQDAFPMNALPPSLTGMGFDTTGAQILNGLNNSAEPGGTRPAMCGDTALVSAAGGNTRVDMIFRIKPGPGNWVSIGHMGTGIAKDPKNRPGGELGVAAVAGDGSFFGTYMEHPGYFSTNGVAVSAGGDVAGGTAMSGGWNIHTWLSARCDTAERNLFPTSNNATQVALTPGIYASMYHEGETGDNDRARFDNATFNVPRKRCVMPIPTGAANSTNIICDGTGWTAYTAASSGWDGVTTTKEYKKIIPDGLLTPGSHVEYFFRRCDLAATSVYDMAPDTNFVIQGNEGSTDGHRWQEFSVLPDRWKDNAWATNERDGPGAPCMLFVDWQDRRGDERIWVGIADTIGATLGNYDVNGFPTGRWGAHNGWHARGNQDITVAISTDPTIAVYAHGGQPGTIWDMFGVKASESTTTGSSIGSRGAVAGTGYVTGKDNKNGPWGDVLRQYYRILFFTVGDLNSGPIGPYSGRTDNDLALLTDYADATKSPAAVRAVWGVGRNLANGLATLSLAHYTFLTTFFGVDLMDDDYRNAAANSNDFVDLAVHDATVITTGSIYGVNNFCTLTEDWLTTAGALSQKISLKYPDTNTPAATNPKAASIYTPPGAGHSHISMIDGFRMTSIGSRNSGSFTQGASSLGRIDYFAQLFKTTGLFGSLTGGYGSGTLNCNGNYAQPVGVGDTPNNALVYFLALRSENPFRSGAAKITFGIVKREKVELKVYDVTGRLVKTLANREFDAGSHDLFWDGTNDDGQLVSRGVYFYQVRTPSFVSQKKLAVLKN